MLEQDAIQRSRAQLLNGLAFRWFLIWRLPMGFLSGMRISKIDENACEVAVRYRWLNKNPFRSTFWAVMGMAAEMSTGAQLVSYTNGQKNPVRFILLSADSAFQKKAKGVTRFVCAEGHRIREHITQVALSGESKDLKLPVIALNEEGERVASFEFTWRLSPSR